MLAIAGIIAIEQDLVIMTRLKKEIFNITATKKSHSNLYRFFGLENFI